MALSILVAKDFLGYLGFEQGIQGTGLDYWMGKKKTDYSLLQIFQREARLEISGIAKETKDNSIKMRIQKKRKQLEASDDSNLPGWVSVVEFGTPKLKFVEK